MTLAKLLSNHYCATCFKPHRLAVSGNLAEHYFAGQVCTGTGKPPAMRCSNCRVPAVGNLALVAKDGGTHYQRRGQNRAVTCGTWGLT